MEYQDYFAQKGQHQQPHQHQIPAFGNWDYYDDIPVIRYFESANQVRGGTGAGAAPYGCGGRYYPADADLFVPPSPLPHHYNQKTLKAAQKPKHLHQQANITSSREQRRQVRVCDAATAAAYPRKKPKAVDEDLYKIPPELLCQRRPKKVAVGGFWRCCIGLGCAA